MICYFVNKGSDSLEDPGYRIRVHTNLQPGVVECRYIQDGDLNGVDYAIVKSYYSEEALTLIYKCKENGIPVALDYNERLHNLPEYHKGMITMLGSVNFVMCCSRHLCKEVSSMGYKVAFVADPIEPSYGNLVYPTFENKMVYSGFGGGGLYAELMLGDIDTHGLDLVKVTEWDDADIKWCLDGASGILRSSPIVVIPQRCNVHPGKSANKLTQAMSEGCIVVCSDLPEYREVVKDGYNGFICKNDSEWSEALAMAKEIAVDPAKRSVMASRAKSAAYRYAGVDVVYEQILSGFQQGGYHTDGEFFLDEIWPKVTIIIPVYNELPYLKACLRSILENTDTPHEIVISDAGSGTETWEFLSKLKGIKVLGSPDRRLSFSQSCNAAIKATSGELLVVLNSDVIVSKGWLRDMILCMRDVADLGSVGVLSNCDVGWLHGPGMPENYNMTLPGGKLIHPSMKLEDIRPHLDALHRFMHMSNVSNTHRFVEREWVAAYATMYSREALSKVGLFDERFINGCEDLDLAKRLSMAGYKCGQAIGSFVFHFGGISRSVSSMEDPDRHDNEDAGNHAAYAMKWPHGGTAAIIGDIDCTTSCTSVRRFENLEQYLGSNDCMYYDELWVPKGLEIGDTARAAQVIYTNENGPKEKMPRNLVGYLHVAVLDDDGIMLAAEMHGRIMQSGMYDRSRVIYVTLACKNPLHAERLKSYIFWKYDKYQIIVDTMNQHVYEFPALNALHELAQVCDDVIWYAHTKGASNCHGGIPDDIQRNIRSWRHRMSAELLDPDKIMEVLDVDYPASYGPLKQSLNGSSRRYSGNFFAANCAYLRNLPSPHDLDVSKRVLAELWIGMDGGIGNMLTSSQAPSDDLYGFMGGYPLGRL